MDKFIQNGNTYVNTTKAKKMLDVTPTTLRTWDKNGQIRTVRTPSNKRMYNLTDIHNILGWDKVAPQEKQKIVYCRVSSKKQMDDLERQKHLLKQKFPNHCMVTDIASGINWKRKGLRSILDSAMQGKLTELVVAHRDRLSRIGFGLIEYILEANKVKLVVLDKTAESPDEELVDDVLSIIHVYSCKRMGQRRYTCEKNKDTTDSDSSEEID